jgi:steroid 5-alpha reductase family enzyme
MNQTTVLSAIQAIQAILAPAVGISAVGLLLLSLNNRYSTIINRIRLLNDERRKFVKLMAEGKELSYPDNARYMSVVNQTGRLLARSRHVRNAILSLQAAAGLFVLTSVAIAVNLFVDAEAFRMLPLILFIVGMLSVLAGIVFAGLEVQKSFRIVLIELKAEE